MVKRSTKPWKKNQKVSSFLPSISFLIQFAISIYLYIYSSASYFFPSLDFLFYFFFLFCISFCFPIFCCDVSLLVFPLYCFPDFISFIAFPIPLLFYLSIFLLFSITHSLAFLTCLSISEWFPSFFLYSSLLFCFSTPFYLLISRHSSL